MGWRRFWCHAQSKHIGYEFSNLGKSLRSGPTFERMEWIYWNRWPAVGLEKLNPPLANYFCLSTSIYAVCALIRTDLEAGLPNPVNVCEWEGNGHNSSQHIFNTGMLHNSRGILFPRVLFKLNISWETSQFMRIVCVKISKIRSPPSMPFKTDLSQLFSSLLRWSEKTWKCSFQNRVIQPGQKVNPFRLIYTVLRVLKTILGMLSEFWEQISTNLLPRMDDIIWL